MTVAYPDRLERLLDERQVSFTGLDFVEVGEDGRTLYVHFHKPPSAVGLSLDNITKEQVKISRNNSDGDGQDILLANEPEPHDDPEVLKLVTQTTGDFNSYSLRIIDHPNIDHPNIDHPKIDPYFNSITFSFKAFCTSDVDCKDRERECPSDNVVDFPVDYQARDFWSLRRALMEFASQRYPHWQDRGREADIGVMLSEVLSAMGDELAYYQDKVAREAYLETATQRRSLRHHAQLVDYIPDERRAAKTWLDITVKKNMQAIIPAGFDVGTVPDQTNNVMFEVGQGLHETLLWQQVWTRVVSDINSGADISWLWDDDDPCLNSVGLKRAYKVDWRRNYFKPYIWDEDATCLPAGTTEIYITGIHADILKPFDDCAGKNPGRWMLLKTISNNAILEQRKWMVRIISAENHQDGLMGEPITHLIWEPEQALPFDMDMSVLVLRGNLVPVTAGRTEHHHFHIQAKNNSSDSIEPGLKGIRPAVERHGPNASVAFLASLPATNETDVVWIGKGARSAYPEMVLVEEKHNTASGTWSVETDFTASCADDPSQWCWRRSLQGVFSSHPYDKHFALDNGMWDRVIGYHRQGKEVIHHDYKTGEGVTIRFGDGEFGLPPTRGSVFSAFYRIGGGRVSNVAKDALTLIAADAEVLDKDGNRVRADSVIDSVTNPIPATGGVDAEESEEIKLMAPEAFSGETYRAVTERDYAEAAERLKQVQRAGAAFRWTGSWLTAFVTPDPFGEVTISSSLRSTINQQLDRFRQAGRETHTLNPKFVDLDLEIHICVEPSTYRGIVKERILEQLLGKQGEIPVQGYFSADNFTFGTPLERSTLESRIQEVPGVRAVKEMTIARRGYFEKRNFTELIFPVAKDEVIRIETDLNHPDRGSVKLFMEGGA